MEKDVYNNFKAKNFLGTFSIRTGLFLISSAQILLGLCLYTILHYLHPSFYYASWALLSLQVICGVLGFFGALKRSIVLESIYLVFSFVSLIFIFITVLDLSELAHFLPKAPEIHDVSMNNLYTSVLDTKLPNAKIMAPLSIYKHPPPFYEFNDNLKNAETQPNSPDTTVTSNASVVADKNTQQVASNKPDSPKETETSLYDSIPFLPHFGETDGEAEEVSKEELPPEIKDLTPEGQSEVVVLYKLQKRPFKFFAAAFLTCALLFNLYSYWIALTFVLNKCTCLDELTSHPDQFEPLID